MKIFRQFKQSTIVLFICILLNGCAYTNKFLQNQSHTSEDDAVTDSNQTAKNKDSKKFYDNEQQDNLKFSENNLNYPKKDIFNRIKKGFAFPPLNSKRVSYQIKRFSRDQKYITRLFNRSEKYLFHVINEVEKRGLPTELALLPVIESAYNPHATSRAKAAGLWQFIPSTGKRYNLRQTWWIDERRDIEKSTSAALNYLEKLNEIMKGDWYLSLAAYNWGENSVNKAVKRNKRLNKKTSYLYLRMPRETRNYVPKLIAIKKILLNPEKYGLKIPFIEDKPYFKTVNNVSSMNLDLVAKLSNVDIKEIRDLNASIKRPILNNKYTTSLNIPYNSFELFKQQLKAHQRSNKPLVTWKTYKLKKLNTLKNIAESKNLDTKMLTSANGIRYPKAKLLAGSKIIIPTQNNFVDYTSEIENFKKPKILISSYGVGSYRVKKGDTLSTIARRYKSSVKKIKRLNNLSSNLIRVGKVLKIHDLKL